MTTPTLSIDGCCWLAMKACEKSIPPMANTRLPEALDRFKQFYTETNKPEEVKKWQAEKEKWQKTVPAKK